VNRRVLAIGGGLLFPVALSGLVLDSARFGNPPAEVRPAMLWVWNSRITDSLIDRQLAEMRRAGLASWTTLDSTYSGTGVYEGTVEIGATMRGGPTIATGWISDRCGMSRKWSSMARRSAAGCGGRTATT